MGLMNQHRIIKGNKRFPFDLLVDGDDLVLVNVTATWFGDTDHDDPTDDGMTASGYATKGHPGLIAASLPMDGQQFPKMSRAEHAALDGSPIPRMPFGLDRHGKPVDGGCRISIKKLDGNVVEIPVIDLGPGAFTGHALDLTEAAFNLCVGPTKKGKGIVSFRIINGAKFLQSSSSGS